MKILEKLRLEDNTKKLFFIILLFSFLVQVFAYTFFRGFEPRSYSTDIFTYDAVAKNLLMGKGSLITRFPPGYSLFLSFLYKITGIWNYKSLYIHIIFLLLLALTVAFCFLIFSCLFGIKVGLISASMLSVYPLYLFLSTRLGLAEHLFFFVFYFALWLFIFGLERKSFFVVFLSSLLFGYASLTRYTSLCYPLIILGYMFAENMPKRHKKVLLIIVFLSGYILSTMTWFIYLIANGQGDNFSNYFIHVGKKGFLHDMRQYEVSKIIISSKPEGLLEYLKISFNAYITHPFTSLIVLCKKLGKSWYATAWGWHQIKILLIQIPIIVSAVWGLIVSLHNRIYKKNLLFCLFSILYFWLVATFTCPILRIMLVGMPFVFVFSSLGMLDIYKKIRT